MAGFLIALLSGALMSVQGVFNAQVTKTTGIWVSNGWVQLSAFLPTSQFQLFGKLEFFLPCLWLHHLFQ